MKTIKIGSHEILLDDDFEHPTDKISVVKSRNTYYARFGRSYLHRIVVGAVAGRTGRTAIRKSGKTTAHSTSRLWFSTKEMQ